MRGPAGGTSRRWAALLLALAGGGAVVAAAAATPAPAPPLSWDIHSSTLLGVPYYLPAGGDKDGALVAARLAGAARGVCATRELAINVTRRADAAYASDVAARIAALYEAAADGPRALLRLGAGAPLVVGSVHRAALYAAEALHAAVLPAQTLAFADTVAQACAAARGGDSVVLVGCDGGYDGIWLWLKPARAAGLPPAHASALARAGALLVVRATDGDGYEGTYACGGGGVLAIHSSLRAFAAARGFPRAAALWAALAPALTPVSPADAAALGQWEWGLPNVTVAAYRDAWAARGGAAADFHVAQGGAVAGFAAVPRLWARYLAANGVRGAPRGVSINSYWIAQPALERADGALPFPAYAFWKPDWHPLWDGARAALAAAVNASGAPAAARHARAFVNDAGSATDAQGVAALWAAAGVAAGATTVVGYDCPPAPCVDAAGRPAPPAHAVAAEALRNATGELLPERDWAPLGVDDVVDALAWGQ